MSPSTRVGAVTVTYNSAAILPAFLDSLAAAGHPAQQTVVVENASPESGRVAALCAERGVEMLALPENLGYGAAINRGVARLGPGYEYLLLSNPDVRIEPEAIRVLSAHLDAHPEAACAGPRVLNADGSVYPSARALPSLRTGIGHALLAPLWPNNRWSRAYRLDESHGDRARPAGWLSGACILIRAEVFAELGGFDEGYFMYFEDVDLGYRLERAGRRSDYVPQARVLHTGGESTKTDSAAMLRAHHDSAYRFLAKKYRGPLLAPVRGVLRLGLSLRVRMLTRRA